MVDHVSARVLARVAEGIETEGSAADRLRATLRAVIVGMTEDPYAPRLLVEQVLFGREEVIDAFVERFASRQFALLDGLLGDGQRSGEFRELEARFLVPQVLGGAIFFFLAQPILERLFGIDEITPELAERFASQFAEVALSGIRVPENAGDEPE